MLRCLKRDKRLPIFKAIVNEKSKALALYYLKNSPLDEALRERLERQLLAQQPICSESLCVFYEKLVPKQASKREGIYYTPIAIARAMAQRMNQRWIRQRKDAARCCDVACGSGIMLIALLKELLLKNAAKLRLRSDREKLLAESLFGIDKDRSAIVIARIVSALAFFEIFGEECSDRFLHSLQQNIIEADSLLDTLPRTHLDPFEIILSNPPYGLSRNGRIDNDENTRLKRRFAKYELGKTNHYLLFIARARELLSDQGLLSLIVPNSWLGIRSAKSLRRLIFEQHEIAEVTSYDYPVFGEPGVEAVSFIIDRFEHPRSVKTYVKRNLDSTPEEIAELPHSFCLRMPGHVLSPKLPASKLANLERVFDRAISLDSPESPFVPAIALQAYARGKGNPKQSASDVHAHIFHLSEKRDASCVRYLEGSDVTRFQTTWSGKYLRYGPWLAEYPPLSRFCGARVLIREITSPLPRIVSAAVTDECFVYNRSVLHVLLKPDKDPDLAWALGALLNSAFASEILYYLGRKTQRSLFPKLVNDDLKSFPLPNRFFERKETLAALAKICQTIGGKKQCATMEVDRINNEIDDIALSLYQD